MANENPQRNMDMTPNHVGMGKSRDKWPSCSKQHPSRDPKNMFITAILIDFGFSDNLELRTPTIHRLTLGDKANRQPRA